MSAIQRNNRDNRNNRNNRNLAIGRKPALAFGDRSKTRYLEGYGGRESSGGEWWCSRGCQHQVLRLLPLPLIDKVSLPRIRDFILSFVFVLKSSLLTCGSIRLSLGFSRGVDHLLPSGIGISEYHFPLLGCARLRSCCSTRSLIIG